jgi:hypothetical protein
MWDKMVHKWEEVVNHKISKIGTEINLEIKMIAERKLRG